MNHKVFFQLSKIKISPIPLRKIIKIRLQNITNKSRMYKTTFFNSYTHCKNNKLNEFKKIPSAFIHNVHRLLKFKSQN